MMPQCGVPLKQCGAEAQRPVAPDDDGGNPPWVACSCCCRSASALPLLTFKAPTSALPVSGTSTQRPPMWLPVFDGTQTMCFPCLAGALACDADTGFRSKFNCVRCSALVCVFMMDAFPPPLTTNVTRYTPAARPSET